MSTDEDETPKKKDKKGKQKRKHQKSTKAPKIKAPKINAITVKEQITGKIETKRQKIKGLDTDEGKTKLYNNRVGNQFKKFHEVSELGGRHFAILSVTKSGKGPNYVYYSIAKEIFINAIKYSQEQSELDPEERDDDYCPSVTVIDNEEKTFLTGMLSKSENETFLYDSEVEDNIVKDYNNK